MRFFTSFVANNYFFLKYATNDVKKRIIHVIF